jgi:hypothetical protein
MKLKKVGTQKEINVNITPYLIDWDAKCLSKYQFEIKQWLRQYWECHHCLEEFVLPGSRLRCDFINLTKNGTQHDKYNKHFHAGQKQNFLNQITRDETKRRWAKINNFSIIEISPSDLPLTLEFFKKNYDLDID